MKFAAAVVLLPVLAGYLQPAQAQYFNKRIDPFGQAAGSTAFAVENGLNGNFVVIAAVAYSDSLFYSSVVASLVLNEAGEVISTDRVVAPLFATYPGWSNSTAKRSDGGFVVGGNNFRIDSLDNWISRPVLYFISATGLLDSLKALGPDEQSWIGRSANQATDGGFLICGETSAIGNGLQAFVIRTDAQGNELWTQTYGGPWSDFIVSVAQAPSGNIYTGGAKYINSSNPELWVQCLSSDGEVIWDKVWGGPLEEPNAAITLASNGDVLVAGSRPVSAGYVARRYLARLSPVDGSFIWQYRYAPQAIDCALQTVKEVLPSMDLIACGSMSESGLYYGTLLRTTSEGDSLWMRHYLYQDTLISNGRGILRDVVPTPDGGFIAVGSALSVPGTYSQDVWVIKVDSMGCLEPGCHLITGIESQVSNLKGALTVAPNPVRAGEAVQLSISLPPSITPQGPLRLTVVSSDGRLVQEQHFAPNSSALTLHTSFAPGLYHLHISDATRWLAGAKVVVE